MKAKKQKPKPQPSCADHPVFKPHVKAGVIKFAMASGPWVSPKGASESMFEEVRLVRVHVFFYSRGRVKTSEQWKGKDSSGHSVRPTGLREGNYSRRQFLTKIAMYKLRVGKQMDFLAKIKEFDEEARREASGG